MNCFFCKGELTDQETIFTTEFNNCIVVIKNVPSLVCSQCGEVVHSDAVSQRLEQIVDSVKSSLCSAEITVISYSAKAA
jgi:YgiT-type zinc finger domain-containing protein